MRHAKPPILVKSAVRLLFNVLKGFAFQTYSASPDFCPSAADLRPETVYISPSLYGTVLRRLNTLVCAGALAMSLGACGGSTDEANLHPVLGKSPPTEIRSQDVLELPENERSAWIHGALSQMIQVYARERPVVSRCVSDWAFEQGDGAEAIEAFLKDYKDELATVTILAVARQACPDI